MSDPYLSQIEAFAFNFAPRGWLLCQGQLLPIQQYQALFALLGTTFGGNGVTTFQLPDLRSRVTVGMGQGPGLSSYIQGETAGVENVSITAANMPGPHTHTVNTNNAASGGTAVPDNTVLLSSAYTTAGTQAPVPVTVYATAAPTVAMNAAAVSSIGGQPHTNIAPVAAVNYCICISGVFPSRN